MLSTSPTGWEFSIDFKALPTVYYLNFVRYAYTLPECLLLSYHGVGWSFSIICHFFTHRHRKIESTSIPGIVIIAYGNQPDPAWKFQVTFCCVDWANQACHNPNSPYLRPSLSWPEHPIHRTYSWSKSKVSRWTAYSFKGIQEFEMLWRFWNLRQCKILNAKKKKKGI